MVKIKVRDFALKELNETTSAQKHSQNISLPTTLQAQEYLTTLPSPNARKIFHIRTGTVDLRAHRKYMYGDNTKCRLCDADTENVYHVVNDCPHIIREHPIEDLSTTNCPLLLEISRRCLDFDNKIKELEQQQWGVECQCHLNILKIVWCHVTVIQSLEINLTETFLYQSLKLD